MSGPFGLGFGAVTPQDYLRLLVRLMPDGYSTDPDGPRMAELEAYATALWIGRVSIDRAYANALPRFTEEMMPEWERALGLPNDAARTLEQRQQRLEAHMRLPLGATRTAMAAWLDYLAPGSEAIPNKRIYIERSAAWDPMIFRVGLKVPEAHFAKPATRRALARLASRALPAHTHLPAGYRAHGSALGKLATDSDLLFVDEDAEWAGASQRFGRSAVARQDAVTFAIRAPRNRHTEFGPLLRLEAADVNALQDLTLMRPCTGVGVLNTYSSAENDQQIVQFAAEAAAGTAVVIDDSIDWRGRHLIASFRHSTSDIRPGEAGDTSTGATQAHLFWSSGAGGNTLLTGVEVEIAPAVNVWIFADDTTGALKIHNATGNTRRFAGTMIATPTLTGGSGYPIHTFADGDAMTSLSAAFWNELSTALPRVASNTSWPNHPGVGCVFRLCHVGGVIRDTSYVLDTEIDWRDRVIMSAAILYRPDVFSEPFAGPAFPGNPLDNISFNAIDAQNAMASGYTGSGLADPTSPHGYRTQVGTSHHLYADDADGFLRLYRADSPPDDPDSFMLVVLASEPLGEREAAVPASPDLSASDGTLISPHTLNGFQDRAMLGQVRETQGNDIDAFPLGAKLDAHGIPEIWRIERSQLIGRTPERQPFAGQNWRWLHATAANGAEVVLDSTIDWRDRLLFGAGLRHTADAVTINGGTRWNCARYMGPGETGASTPKGYGVLIEAENLVIRARLSDGALVLRNQTGATRYVAGIICGSPQLGPRTP
jgi:hypothetical protein